MTSATTSHSPVSRRHGAAFWRAHWLWLVIAVFGISGIVLGWWGFSKYFRETGEPRSVFDVAYFVLCLFFVEGSDAEGPVPWQLQAARLLAPLATGGALLKAGAVVFREQLKSLRLGCARNHVVICGLGRKGLQLVEDFRNSGETVVVIESDEQNDRIQICRDLGAIVLVGDATESSLLLNARVDRAGYVVAISGNDGTNVDIAVRCYQLVKGRRRSLLGRAAEFFRPPGGKPWETVRCFVQVVDLQLCRLLREHRMFTVTSDPFELRLFNTYENSARTVFHNHPLDHCRIVADDPRQVHLVVVGFGQMGQSVVLQAARTAHYANGKRLRVTVIDFHAEAKKRRFYSRYPQFDNVADTEFVQIDVGDPTALSKIVEWTGDENCLTTIAVCIDGDTRCLSCALSIRSKLDGECPTPVLVRMSDEAGLATLLEGALDESNADEGGGSQTQTRDKRYLKEVHPFGATDQCCTRELLLDEKLDLLAQMNHDHQVENRRAGGRKEDDPSMQPWERLPENLKDSNRQQADHIPVKLRAVECYSSATATGDDQVDKFEKEEIDLLAKMEHARWNAERWLDGWTRGEKCHETKTSPYLVSWEKLEERVRNFNREPVRIIPDLLASIGEKIFRRPRT